MSIQPATIDMIKIIAAAFGNLNDRAVFVGGATVPFYLPEAYLSLARPTEDIDVVMEVVGCKEGWLNDEASAQKVFSTIPNFLKRSCPRHCKRFVSF